MWYKIFLKIKNLLCFLFGIKSNAKKRQRIKKYSKEIHRPNLNKPSFNPIISPQAKNPWEAWQTFNPGAILIDNKIHFLYRAVGKNWISVLGYACSEDGFHVSRRNAHPVYQHNINKKPFNIYSYSSGGSLGGCEDPRIVRVGKENTIYITYTAAGNGELRVAITSIKINNFLKHKWKWKHPILISPPNEVNKNWVLFPEKINGKYAILHSISPKILIEFLDNLDFKNGECIKSFYDGNVKDKKKRWDNWVRGVGAPPIKTKYGWLVFYHAMNKNDFSKYKVGAMILDINNPAKILYKANNPVIEPDKDYENNGFKPGVVYLSGAIIKNGELLVYYGGSDSYVCVAHTNLEEFLDKLIKSSSHKFSFKNIVRKK